MKQVQERETQSGSRNARQTLFFYILISSVQTPAAIFFDVAPEAQLHMMRLKTTHNDVAFYPCMMNGRYKRLQEHESNIAYMSDFLCLNSAVVYTKRPHPKPI